MKGIPQRKTFRVGGQDISYLEEGAGEPMIMLHGLMSNAVDWYFVFREFSGGRRLIAPDYRGHGMSRAEDPASVSLHGTVDELEEFIRAMIPDGEKATIMGHSFGGLLTQELAARMPERFKRVVIVASPPVTPDGPAASLALELLTRLLPFSAPVFIPPVINFYSTVIDMPPWAARGEVRDVVLERNSLITHSSALSMGAYFSSARGWRSPLLDNPPDIPTLIVFGGADMIVPLRSIERYREALPDARAHVMRSVRHSVMLERPEEFNRILGEFLAET